MHLIGLDHIVLCVRDVDRTIRFYCEVLEMDCVEERQGKWSLHFGANKISLQDASHPPAIAEGTLPGTGNFCILSDTPMEEIVAKLEACSVTILDGPGQRMGAVGPICSVYFHDPDGNLVEVSNQLDRSA